MIKEKYIIEPIDYKTAETVVVKCHYAHRKCSCVKSFGLFSKSPKRLVGVIIYGIPASPFVCRCICGKSEELNVYELTRLYVDDGLENNLESYFISKTLKMLDRDIVISYSDTAYNHIGYVYQACNFIYTGITSSRFDPVSENGKHNRHNKNTVQNGKIERSQKHRYIYFACSKGKRRYYMSKLQLPILPYPKSDNPCAKTSDINIRDNVTKRKLF